MESFADGFQGSTAIASVTAVAENRSQNSDCAENAVAVLRDTFAEGVAYGVVDVLKDAIDEINAVALEGDQDPCSLAAAAVLGDEVWVYSTGTCRAFMSGAESGGRGLEKVVDLSSHGIEYFKLKPGQSIIIVTHGLRKLMGSAAALSYSSRCKKPLSFCLSEMVRETRIRFRKKGGSVAAVRLCIGSSRMNLPVRKLVICLFAAVLAVVSAFFIFCYMSEENNANIQADSSFTDETVMPLD
jgi:hypothetical protein